MTNASLRHRILFHFLLLTGFMPGATFLKAQGTASQHTLSNGIPVLYFEDSLRSVAGLSLVVRAGSQVDAAGSDGISTLWSRVFWERGEDSLQYARWARRHGILTTAQNSLSHTQFNMVMPPWRLSKAFQLLGTAVDDAVYPGRDLDRARKDYAVILQDLDNNPDVFLERQTGQAMWGDRFPEVHRYGYFPDLYGQVPKAYRQLHRTYCHPGNVMLIGNGPMASSEFFHLADSLFGYWVSGKPAPYPPLAAMPDLPESKYEVLTNEFAEAVKIRMSWAVPGAYEGPSAVQFAEWFAYAAQSRQGPFFEALIGAELASQFQWEYTPTRGPGQMNLTLIPHPDRVKDCLAAVNHCLYQMSTEKALWEGLEEGIELSRKGQWASWRDVPNELLYFMGRAWSAGTLEEALDGESQVGLEALMAFVERYLYARPHVAGLLANSQTALQYDLEGKFQPVIKHFVAATDPVDTVEAGEEHEKEAGEEHEKEAGEEHEKEPLEALPPPLVSEAEFEWLSELRIYFESSSFQPDSVSLGALRRVAKILRQDSTLRMHVNGYADGQGDGVYNYQLSIQRAESVRNIMLQSHGILPERLVVKGWGEAFAEYPDDTPKHMALNRRVTFTVIKEKGDRNAL